MATLKTVIVPAKVLKEGRHKVRISVAHNGETRYIATNIIIDSDKEFKTVPSSNVRTLQYSTQSSAESFNSIKTSSMIWHISTV